MKEMVPDSTYPASRPLSADHSHYTVVASFNTKIDKAFAIAEQASTSRLYMVRISTRTEFEYLSNLLEIRTHPCASTHEQSSFTDRGVLGAGSAPLPREVSFVHQNVASRTLRRSIVFHAINLRIVHLFASYYMKTLATKYASLAWKKGCASN